MNLTRTTTLAVLGTGLALALGCGGSGGGAPAASTATTPQSSATLSLAYADATDGTVILVRDAALSTPTHLVLDVVGTDANTLSAGLLMTLSVEPTVAQWSKVQPADGDLVENGAVYDLGTGPQILKAKASAGTLTFVVGQKGYFNALGTSGVLAKVAMDLQPAAVPGQVIINTTAAGNTLLTDAGALVAFTPGIGNLAVQ